MQIRAIKQEDKSAVLQMMDVFYHSPAVHTDGSAEIYRSNVENCLNDNPYLEGYVFDDGKVLMGYAMLAKSFSTEFGKPCIWIEDLYITPSFRGMGIGQRFLQFVAQQYPDAVIRLEVEEENELAVYVYKKGGFEALPYLEMIKK